MNKVYLQLEFSTGKIFEYSKEPKEGYVEFTSSKGNKSYRKYHRGVTGELESVSIRDTQFGQEISVALKSENTVSYLTFGLMDQKGFVDNVYCEDLISKLPKLHKGATYTINPYRFTPEGKVYDQTGVSIKQGDLKIEKAYTNSYTTKEGEEVQGDIPAVKWKKDATGKNKPSAASKEIRSDFFLEKLSEQVERLKWTPSTSASYGSSQPTTEAPVAKPAKRGGAPVVTVSVDEESELPF
jgi:hypothetical protein